MANRLLEKYKKDVKPVLIKELGIKNVMEVPRITKVVLNSGIGDFRDKKEAVASFAEELTDIAGQKVSERRSRLSEAGFKIRKGDLVGFAVTLRGEKMWAFLDKFISIVLPRVRDFRGLNPKAFDTKGNYSVGIEEHTIFPEVNPNTTKGIRGFQVTVVTTAENAQDSKKLLTLVGFPFKEEVKKDKNNG